MHSSVRKMLASYMPGQLFLGKPCLGKSQVFEVTLTAFLYIRLIGYIYNIYSQLVSYVYYEEAACQYRYHESLRASRLAT